MAPPVLGRHLALVGFMGAGKSTIGREVAQRLGRRFVDVDDVIGESAELPLAELWAQYGEEYFRKLEQDHLASCLHEREPAVIAPGAGAVETESVRDELRRAFVVLLDVDADEAWSRVRGSDRPLAKDEAMFRERYERRLPLYEEVADAVAADTDGVVLEAAGIVVEEGSLARLGELVPGDAPVALVTEPRVRSLYGVAAEEALGGRLSGTHELPEGEAAKSPDRVARLWEELRIGRDGLIVALGGGSLTDAAGFAASAFLRGVDWCAVPTTLLGQVDAAIGGKTAVDLDAGKNLVGAFHWPARTVIDPSLLVTLPDEERREGRAEVVKTGLLAGEPLWELPEAEAVRRCAAYKAGVCLRDPLERGERVFLNLGHTFAHALEAGTEYRVRHGHAVALGLLAALRLSGLGTQVVHETLAPEPVRADRARAWEALQRDKKGGRLVLLERPGKPVVREVPEADVRAALEALIAG